MTMLSVRVPSSLHRRLRIHLVTREGEEESVQSFTARAATVFSPPRASRAKRRCTNRGSRVPLHLSRSLARCSGGGVSSANVNDKQNEVQPEKKRIRPRCRITLRTSEGETFTAGAETADTEFANHLGAHNWQVSDVWKQFRKSKSQHVKGRFRSRD